MSSRSPCGVYNFKLLQYIHRYACAMLIVTHELFCVKAEIGCSHFSSGTQCEELYISKMSAIKMKYQWCEPSAGT